MSGFKMYNIRSTEVIKQYNMYLKKPFFRNTYVNLLK